MKRSPLKPGNKPLKRTAFARAERKAVAEFTKLQRRTLKTRGPRMTPIRASARDEECTLRFPFVCNYRTDTTALCHDNRLESGKGMGLKAPDTCAAYGCSACHDVLDGRAPRPAGMTYEDMLERFDCGVALTHERLRAKELMK